MKESPILYSTPMVQAILEGRKTMTRRIFKNNPRLSSDLSCIDLKDWYRKFPELIHQYSGYGKPGDILWVRESFLKTHGMGYAYKATWSDMAEEVRQEFLRNGEKAARWKPSIHMPREAARIWLQITGTRVERLQEITDADAIAEGVWLDDTVLPPGYTVYGMPHYNSAVDCFRQLWEAIHGDDSWEGNPWLWVIEFEALSTTGREDAYRVLESREEHHG